MTHRILNAICGFFRSVEKVFIFVIGISLLIGAFLSACIQKEIMLVGFYAAFVIICVITTFMLRGRLIKAKIGKRVIYVVITAFIIRAFACNFLIITQRGDYGNYLSVAQKISSNSFTRTIYYGIFPHALNYPVFISGVYKLTSASLPWISQMINLMLGVIEAGCAAVIAETGVHKLFGLFAGLAVALNPCMILFTLFAGGEPVYGALIMIALLIFTWIYKINKKFCVFFAVITGLTVAFANFFRPTGIIFIIAALLVFTIYDKSDLKGKLIRSAALVASYAAAVFLMGLLTSSVSGYEKPSPSYGWNLFIGANKESKGSWNAADAELFNKKIKEYDNPSYLQSYFAQLGLQRYRDMKTGLPRHFINKIAVWFDESFITNSVTKWQNEYTRFHSVNIAQTYRLICYFYNLIMVIGTMAAMIAAVYKKEPYPAIKLTSLYFQGTVIIFMILEFSSRYKGAYYGILTLLGAYGIYIVQDKIRRKFCGKSRRPDLERIG